jgi:hypothetical protein
MARDDQDSAATFGHVQRPAEAGRYDEPDVPPSHRVHWCIGMTSTRTRRSIAYVCVAAALLAALLPGVSIDDYAVPEPGWILLPDIGTLHRHVPADAADVPASTPPAPAPGRAPPSLASHA